jgi:tRNA (adenine57-N1/adenine58-N1)-methyltransferase
LFLDLPTPWQFLEQAHAALAGGAPLGGLLPTMNQIVELSIALSRVPFAQIEIEELLLRPYKTAPGRVRPVDRMVAHTGYLYFARKLVAAPRAAPAGPDDAAPAAGAEFAEPEPDAAGEFAEPGEPAEDVAQ